jgi:hypothetical protein
LQQRRRAAAHKREKGPQFLQCIEADRRYVSQRHDAAQGSVEHPQGNFGSACIEVRRQTA